MALQLALQLRHVVDRVRLVIVALPARLMNMEELLQAALVLVARYARLEHIPLQGLQLAHYVILVDMALHPALHLLRVLDHVLLVIHALRVQLMNMEELLQAALVLAASYVLQDMNAMVLQKHYALQVNTLPQEQQPAHHAPLVVMDQQLALQLRHAVERVQLEHILSQGQAIAHHVLLVVMALQPALQILHAVERVHLEHILLKGRQPALHVPLVVMDLQPALQLLHVVEHVLLAIHALPARLTNMEELPQAALVLVARCVLQAMNAMVLQKHYALQVNTLLQEHQLVHHAPLVVMGLQLASQLRHALEHVRLERILLKER